MRGTTPEPGYVSVALPGRSQPDKGQNRRGSSKCSGRPVCRCSGHPSMTNMIKAHKKRYHRHVRTITMVFKKDTGPKLAVRMAQLSTYSQPKGQTGAVHWPPRCLFLGCKASARNFGVDCGARASLERFDGSKSTNNRTFLIWSGLVGAHEFVRAVRSKENF